MRNFIVWTLAILLGFEPALWAQGRAQQQAQIKAWLEKSELAKRPVSLREFYEKNASLLTVDERESLKKFVDAYGDQKLPKMDVTKVKESNGEESYRLQAVQNGRSVTWEILDNQNAFARINGVTLTDKDMGSVPAMMAKLGVPASDVQKYFSRSPASTKTQKSPILKADQIVKLSTPEKVQFYKRMRLLMESMEAVENSFAQHKTSSFEFQNKFEFVLQLLQGSELNAASERSCVAAGWPAVARPDKGNRLKCGSDGKSGVAEEYRRKSVDGDDLCPVDKFACNPAIYGSGNGKADLCVAGSKETTATCNARIKDQDIPDIAKTKAEFEATRDGALQEAERVMSICGGTGDEPLEDAPAGTDSKGSKKANGKSSKASKKNKGSKGSGGLDADQKYTCEKFRERYELMKTWSCEDADFASKHPQACKEETATPPPPTPGQPPGPTPTNPTVPRCDQLPDNQASKGTICEGDSIVGNPTSGVKFCFDGKEQIEIVECSCPGGKLIGKMRCEKSKKHDGRDDDDDRGGKKKKEKSGPNWWLIGGLGLGGLLLFHWLNKKSLSEQYKQMEPLPQNPPLPLPTVTVPAPRGVQ